MTDALAQAIQHAAATAPRSWRLYSSDLRDLARSVEDAHALLQSPADWRRIVTAWVDAMRDRGLAPRTIARRVAAARAVHRAAVELGVVSWTAPRIRIPPAAATWATLPAPWPRLVAVGDALDDLAAAGDHHAARTAACWWLALHSGLRRGEIAALRCADLGALGQAPAVTVRRKRGRVETLPVSAQAARALEVWRALGGIRRGPVFGRRGRTGARAPAVTGATVGRWIAHSAAAHGIRVRAHDLRRACLTMAARISHAPELVAQLAGHASVATTSRYLAGDPSAMIALVAALGRERGQQVLPFELDG